PANTAAPSPRAAAPPPANRRDPHVGVAMHEMALRPGRLGTRLTPGRQREERGMAKSPEENNAEWAEAFNAGDGEALLALYDPEAKFVMPTGDVLEGVESIGQALGGFFALKPQIDLRTERVLRCGDTAISNGSWT